MEGGFGVEHAAAWHPTRGLVAAVVGIAFIVMTILMSPVSCSSSSTNTGSGACAWPLRCRNIVLLEAGGLMVVVVPGVVARGQGDALSARGERIVDGACLTSP